MTTTGPAGTNMGHVWTNIGPLGTNMRSVRNNMGPVDDQNGVCRGCRDQYWACSDQYGAYRDQDRACRGPMWGMLRTKWIP